MFIINTRPDEIRGLAALRALYFGFRVTGLRFRVSSLVFRVTGRGFRDSGLGFRITGLWVPVSGSRGYDLRFRVSWATIYDVGSDGRRAMVQGRGVVGSYGGPRGGGCFL